MSSETTLTSLAMLKVNISQGKDYLEYLRPFILRVLKHGGLEIITDLAVAEKIREIHGLEIPQRTVHIVLQRLIRAGQLQKTDGVYRVLREVEAKDWTADNAAASRKIASVVHWLREFAKDSANRELDDAAVMDCLVSFLSKFSIPCMKAYLRGTALPSVNGNGNWKVVLVSQYVQLLQRTNPEHFDNFMVIVQGHMLANALLCPDLQSVANTYKDVIFYLDTPLLIQFLGLEGAERKKAIGDLVSLVQRLDGRISYFTHTREELINVINGAANFIDSPKGRGAIVFESRRAGLSRADLLLFAESVIEHLADAAIEARQTPAYMPAFQIDESAFSNALSDEVNYYNSRAREYDINSVRSIYALRTGTCPHSVEKSKAVLVTNNAGFSKAAYDYGKNIEQSREVSTVITDFSLANTAWLKAPQGAPSLPRNEVIAFSYAALRPTTDFWEKFLKETEKLENSGKISSRDHQLLRSSQHVQDELMKLTLGEDSALNEGTITGTLSRVVSEIKKEEAQKLNLSEKSRADLEQRLEETSAKNEGIKQKIYWQCDMNAKREARLLTVFVWLSQLYVAVFGVLKLQNNNNLGWLLLAVSIISGILRLLGTFFDLKPLKIYSQYHEWRRQKMILTKFDELGIEV